MISLLNQFFFSQNLQQKGSFLGVSLLLPTANNSKTIAVISGIYLTAINWVHSYCVFEKALNISAFSISLKFFFWFI